MRRLRTASDSALRELGGDPSGRDWALFRPLRRQREEDWSDWLAQLIEDSTTGRFAWSLLGRLNGAASSSPYAAPEVRRELLYEGYRADLIIDWGDGTYTHIEVKVGDSNLAKTMDTAQKMERYFHGHLRRRCDAILLLPSQRGAWAAECDRNVGMRERVNELTWVDVARALHETLRSGDETLSWRIWAHAFCGAIQQELLGLQFRPTAEEWVRALTPSDLDVTAKLLGGY